MDPQAFDLLMKKFEDIEGKISEVENKVDALLAFKWQIIGGSVLLSIILTAVINIAALFVR